MPSGASHTLRPATVADAAAVAEVHVRSWQKAYRGMLLDSVLDGLSVDEWTHKRRMFLERASPGQRFWVLEQQGHIAGFSDSGPSRDEDQPASESIAEIYAMYLHPDRWGEGRGRGMMAHCLDDLRSQSWRRVNLWVLDNNTRARRFYEAAGFVADGTERDDSFRGCHFVDLRYGLVLA